MKTIANNTFSKINSLKNVSMGNGVNVIKDYTFSYCSNLEAINIYDIVKKIDAYVFIGCSKLPHWKVLHQLVILLSVNFLH